MKFSMFHTRMEPSCDPLLLFQDIHLCASVWSAVALPFLGFGAIRTHAYTHVYISYDTHLPEQPPIGHGQRQGGVRVPQNHVPGAVHGIRLLGRHFLLRSAAPCGVMHGVLCVCGKGCVCMWRGTFMDVCIKKPYTRKKSVF